MRERRDLTRRGVLKTGTLAVAAAVVPPWAWAMPAAAWSNTLPRRVSLPPARPDPSKLVWYRDLFEQAAIAYETSGETEALQDARWTLYWKLGFIMARIPRCPREREGQISGFHLLEAVASAYPEVPYHLNIRADVERYRAWGCAEGRTA